VSIPHDQALRAILWCAVSSERQAEDEKASLEEQERLLRERAGQDGWQIVDVLIVPGFSRRFYNLPELISASAAENIYAPARLMEHLKARDFDVFAARYGTRFAREQSIFGEVVARIIDSGARLFTLQDGWIHKGNYRMYISMGGYAAAVDIDKLMAGKDEGLTKRAENGLLLGSQAPMSHRVIRDAKSGEAVGVELNPEYLDLWPRLAALLLGDDGHPVPFLQLENELYRRYGYASSVTGRAFEPQTFYRLLHNPVFWGHLQRYRHTERRKGLLFGEWTFDPSVPPPEGVDVYYDKVPAVFTGELAERVQDELRRRKAVIRGKARPQHTTAFAGLLVCGGCGYTMVYDSKRRRHGVWRGYKCISTLSRLAGQRPEGCSSVRRSINFLTVKSWIDQRLRQTLEGDDYALWLPQADSGIAAQIDAAYRLVKQLEEDAGALIRKRVPESLADLHQREMTTIGERLHAARQQLAMLQHAELRQHQNELRVRTIVSSLRDANLPEWWQDETRVNQTLWGLLSGSKLVVENGQIRGIANF
jgi:hypothetical protein